MTGDSKLDQSHRDAEGPAKDNLFAEGMATAVAVAILASVAFLLFRG